MSLLRVASVGLLVLAGGCIIGEDATGEAEQHLPMPPGCDDDFGCGLNSPEVDHLGIHDLFGRPLSPPIKNKNGFYVTKLIWTQPAPCSPCLTKTMKEVRSEGGVLRMFDGVAWSTSVRGLSIWVEGPAGKYEIKVQGTGRTPYWAHATGGEWATTYLLEWDVQLAPGQKHDWKAVCTNPPSDGDPELMGMDRFQSIVFEGDNIDATSKTIKARDMTKEANWFNIGCAGHALAKLHLTGHTYGSNVAYPAYHTNIKDRQTTLKMFAADYCGTGYPFTVAGQKLGWTDAPGFNLYLPGFAGVKEAEWSDTGARCLNKPRILANPTVLGSTTFPTLMNDIKTECGIIPSCSDDNPNLLNGAHIISSNPF